MSAVNYGDNFEHFRDALAARVIEKLSQDSEKRLKRSSRRRKNSLKQSTGSIQEDDSTSDQTELSEFVEYLAEEIFASLPDDLRTVSYAITQENAGVEEKYAVPLNRDVVSEIAERLPPSVPDSFFSYGLVGEDSDLERFLDPVLTSYITTATAAPPEYTPALTTSRPDGCEICGRQHLRMTYHHLIPRQSHAKAVKRGWHKEWQLNKVCWLCRACHSYVHTIATNDELAKEYYDVDLLLEREDIQKWAAWAGRIRWKAR